VKAVAEQTHTAVPLLEVEDVRKSFPVRRDVSDLLRHRGRLQVVALDGVSATVNAHQTLGIVGESGCGKSTLAKTLVRLVEPDSGAIRFRDQDVVRAGSEELRGLRRAMQIVYQDPYSSLNPRLTVQEAILEPIRVHKLVPQSQLADRLAELLTQVGLPERIGRRRPRELSGGQRQRVAIARALAAQPELLIADEVVSALDVSIQAQVLNVLIEMQRDLHLAMVFISHNLPVVGHVAENVAVMYLGRVVEYGPTAQVFSEPAHPYTEALLNARPSRTRRSREAVAVRGEIPSALRIPSGCRFRARCPLAQPICAEVDPPPIELGNGHRSWCHVLPARRLAGDASSAPRRQSLFTSLKDL
jgi:peptide/nickel transport system ATP-binding protein